MGQSCPAHGSRPDFDLPSSEEVAVHLLHGLLGRSSRGVLDESIAPVLSCLWIWLLFHKKNI
jgi:hypothetical protein